MSCYHTTMNHIFLNHDSETFKMMQTSTQLTNFQTTPLPTKEATLQRIADIKEGLAFFRFLKLDNERHLREALVYDRIKELTIYIANCKKHIKMYSEELKFRKSCLTPLVGTPLVGTPLVGTPKEN